MGGVKLVKRVVTLVSGIRQVRKVVTLVGGVRLVRRVVTPCGWRKASKKSRNTLWVA